MTSVECYIEEYKNERGQPGARLGQKRTGKKVDLGFVDVDARQHFLRFLTNAKRNEALQPGLFSKDDDQDYIAVSGDLDFDAPDEMRFVPNGNLQYLVA